MIFSTKLQQWVYLWSVMMLKLIVPFKISSRIAVFCVLLFIGFQTTRRRSVDLMVNILTWPHTPSFFHVPLPTVLSELRLAAYRMFFSNLWLILFFSFSFFFLSDDSQLLFAKATQLPALLENEKQTVEQEIKQLHHNRMLRDKQFRQLFEVCFRASSNGPSTDNVRSKMGFVGSNPGMTEHFARSFTLQRKTYLT